MPDAAPLSPAGLARVLRAMGATASRAGTYAPLLTHYAGAYGVSTPLRWAHLLAQLMHESGRLRYNEEIASGAAYEGRADLGNTEPGDGRRFKGRGLIQLTGRTNYRLFTQRIRAEGYDAPDFERNPESVALLPWSVLAAFDYWDRRRINETADMGDHRKDVAAVTRKVNGGTNGLEDRVDLFLIAAEEIRREAGMAPGAPLDAWPEPEPPAPTAPLPAEPPVSPPEPDPTASGAAVSKHPRGVSKLPPGTTKGGDVK